MNPITHFEIPAKSKEESKKFYEDVFGWKYVDMDEMNYTVVHTSEVDEENMPTMPGAVNGGMMTAEDNGGLNPVLVVYVPNLEDSVAKIEEAGGEIIMPKTKVGDMGFYLRFKDTAGVVMGLWQDA